MLLRTRLHFFLFALTEAMASFALLCFSTGCREAIHDEFLLAEPCKCVSVGDVLKYFAADKCNE